MAHTRVQLQTRAVATTYYSDARSDNNVAPDLSDRERRKSLVRLAFKKINAEINVCSVLYLFGQHLLEISEGTTAHIHLTEADVFARAD